jgi:hypothetical protein
MFAFLQCDLLILDEVLSVGDVFFAQKCYARMEELHAQNTAMIMVTHNMSAIQQYCQRAIVIDKGRIIYSGTPAEASKHYFFVTNPNAAPRALASREAKPGPPHLEAAKQPAMRWPAASAFRDLSETVTIGEGWARCTALALCDDDGDPCQAFQCGQRAHWYYEFEALEDMYAPNGHVLLANEKNVRVHGKNTVQLGVRPKQPLLKGMRIRFRQSVTLNMTPGEYGYSVGLSASLLDDQGQIQQRGFLACDVARAGALTVIGTPRHLGLADLPGECEVELCSSTYLPTLDLEIHGSGT